MIAFKCGYRLGGRQITPVPITSDLGCLPNESLSANPVSDEVRNLTDTTEFEGLEDARRLTAQWKETYNHYRPHSSLGYMTPAEFAAGTTFVQATPSLR